MTEAPEQVEKFPELRKQLDILRAEKKQLAAVVAPLRERRDSLVQQMRPIELEIRALDKQIAGLERPRMAELDNQISALARVMGARVMSQPEVPAAE